MKYSTLVMIAIIIAIIPIKVEAVIQSESPFQQQQDAIAPGETVDISLSNGSANVQYPIETPPGANSFQPDISLQYSTTDVQPFSGLLGRGWSVPIFSYIYGIVKLIVSEITDNVGMTKQNTSSSLLLQSLL